MATYIKKPQNKNKPHAIRYQFEGKQREKSFRTKTEAMDFKAKFEHDSRAQIFVDPSAGNVKFSVAAERWVETLVGAESSKVTYRRVLRNHINPAMGGRYLRAVANDREGLEDFLKIDLPAKGLSASYIKTCYIVVRAVVNAALKSGRLEKSRINGISLPQASQRAHIVWPTYAQMELMADQMPENYGDVLWLMRGCGLRVGEALGLRWDDFDLPNGTVRVQRQLLPDGSYGPLKHRREGDFREVPVPSYLWDKLAGLALNDTSDYLFPGASRRNVDRWIAKAKEYAELPSDFTAHMLRHIFASVSLSNGVPITDVSAWLGHRNINTTYSIYGHLVPSSVWKARHALDDEYAVWRNTSALDT